MISDSVPLYLRPNVKVEPLYDLWYAWPYLIPPATAARNITERHFKIMESYLMSPELHQEAAKNPQFQGGPFMDYVCDRTLEIRTLMERTKRDRAPLLSLSKAIEELDRLIEQNARGYSMLPLYADIPEPLKGYVELVYDLNHQPSFRILEPLLYNSGYYDRSAQSLMMSMINGDDRPFVMSTPRLQDPGACHLPWAFDRAEVDRLFATLSAPASKGELRELLKLPEQQWVQFFSQQQPPPYQAYQNRGLRWRYFGHACILIETEGVSCLFDPVLSYTYESGISRYTYQDLPPVIDYVCITHNHTDHILFETLLQLRGKIRHIVVPATRTGALQDPSMALMLRRIGFRNVIELGEYDSCVSGPVTIIGLPFLGEHCDVNVPSKLVYLVRIGKHSLMLAADTCNMEPLMYRHVHRDWGDVEVLFIGMECNGAPLSWLFQPLLTRKLDREIDQSRRFAGSDFDQVWTMVRQFNCQQVYVYAMGQEPWLNYVLSLKYTAESKPIIESNRLLAACRERGILAERLFGEKEIFLD